MNSLEDLSTHPYFIFLSEQSLRVENWKWLLLIIGFALGLILQPIVKWIVRFFQNQYLGKKRTTLFWKSLFEIGLDRNIGWIFAALLWMAAIDAAHFPEKIDKYLKSGLQIILIINLFRIIYIFIEAFSKVLSQRASMTESILDDQLVPFASKTMKGLVILLGGLLTLQSFGVNVNSVLAGLGIGGMAVAFAAQESIAGIFGSIVILIDGPFKLGDYVKAAGTEGTVEHIGFRSTRIRALDDTLVVIPNSTMVKENINNLTERNRRRITQTLGILYETDVKTIESFMEHIRYHLAQHSMVQKDSIVVTFSGFGDFSLFIRVIFYVMSPKAEDEHRVQSEIYLEFMRIAQNLGVGFAYPTQTVYQTNLEPVPVVKHLT